MAKAKQVNPLIAAIESGVKPKGKFSWFDRQPAEVQQWLLESRDYWVAHYPAISANLVWKMLRSEPPNGIGLRVARESVADWLKEALQNA